MKHFLIGFTLAALMFAAMVCNYYKIDLHKTVDWTKAAGWFKDAKGNNFCKAPKDADDAWYSSHACVDGKIIGKEDKDQDGNFIGLEDMVQPIGPPTCVFSGIAGVGNYVKASSPVAGACTVGGPSGQVIGRVVKPTVKRTANCVGCGLYGKGL